MSPDPLANERFRTIIADVLGNLDDDEPYENAVDGAVAVFPDAHFERKVNESGVAVRRVWVASEWEIDPDVTNRPPGEPARDGDLDRRSDGQLIEYRKGRWHSVDAPIHTS